MYLICDLTTHDHFMDMRIYGRELLVLFHHNDKSWDHKHCGDGDMFFFCHVTSCEHMFEGLSEFYEWTPVTVIHHLPIFGNHWSSASGDIKHLIYRVTYQNHLIDGPSNFMSASSSWHVITLPSLGD